MINDMGQRASPLGSSARYLPPQSRSLGHVAAHQPQTSWYRVATQMPTPSAAHCAYSAPSHRLLPQHAAPSAFVRGSYVSNAPNSRSSMQGSQTATVSHSTVSPIHRAQPSPYGGPSYAPAAQNIGATATSAPNTPISYRPRDQQQMHAVRKRSDPSQVQGSGIGSTSVKRPSTEQMRGFKALVNEVLKKTVSVSSAERAELKSLSREIVEHMEQPMPREGKLMASIGKLLAVGGQSTAALSLVSGALFYFIPQSTLILGGLSVSSSFASVGHAVSRGDWKQVTKEILYLSPSVLATVGIFAMSQLPLISLIVGGSIAAGITILRTFWYLAKRCWPCLGEGPDSGIRKACIDVLEQLKRTWNNLKLEGAIAHQFSVLLEQMQEKLSFDTGKSFEAVSQVMNELVQPKRTHEVYTQVR